MPKNTVPAAYYRGNRSFDVGMSDYRAPGEGEVALRPAFCGICGTDMHVYHGNMDGRVGTNRILGHEMSGTVEEVGAGVDGIAPGDRVVVRPLDPCGDCPACRAGHDHICHKMTFLGLDADGALQGSWTVPAHTLHHLPEGMRMDHAALVEPTAVACHDVRMAGVADGEDVVVIGGGPIGILVAMVARSAGGKVVISEVNAARLKIAEGLDFDVVNPVEADLPAEIMSRTAQKGADVVFEVSGVQAGVDAMTAVCGTRARICMVAIHAKKPTVDMFQFFWRELKLIGARVYEPEDYDRAISLLAAGEIAADTIVTDVSPLSEIQAAFEALDRSPTAMKSLIKVGEDA